MKVAVVDYGMGNLGSVNRALALLGAQGHIAGQPDDLKTADRIILPGVGSFGDGMRHLTERGWVEEIRRQVLENGKPLLGICLGMQLLATMGTEGEDTLGLGLIAGRVVRLDTIGCTLRIPHVGWNSIALSHSDSALFQGIPDGTDFYFVHSFAFQPANGSHIDATTPYDIPVVAAVSDGAVLGTQFHPEKSSKAGLRLLRNFLDFTPC